MKRIYLFLLMAGLALNASAQKQPDLSLLHFWGKTSTMSLMKDNDKMLIDGGTGNKIYFRWMIINHGATATDTIAMSDTVKVKTEWTTFKITWGQSGFSNGMTQHDTTLMIPGTQPVDLNPPSSLEASVNDDPRSWCDSVFIVSGVSTNSATDPNTSNNKTCNNILITYWVTGIDDVIGGNGLLMYPNPVTNKLNIKYNFLNADASVQIVDVSGKMVYSRELGKNISGMQEFGLDIAHLGPGMYFLKLATGDKTVMDKFFIR